MDLALKDYLAKNKIEYKEHKHQAVFTVEESNKLNLKLPCLHTKSLFLRDNNNKFYLVSMSANNRLNIKQLKRELNIKELHFASPEELKQHLNLTPGSVSIFGMIHSNSTTLILDKEVWDTKSAGFHPNINTSTLEITHENLEKFYNSLKSEKRILKLE